ncbi:MAG TPA: hypothetical protein VMW17_13720 [Candidatus Binatia bacterium]|nr:hypothetical protein [Candidatus Binatia bacterium]
MATAVSRPRPADIWLYYERCQVALAALRNEAVIKSIAATGGGPFFQLTSIEYEDALSDMRDELDDQVTLALVASFEASFRIDFEQRVRRRLKDGVSREFRTIARQYGQRVKFEDILDIWKQASGRPHRFRKLVQLLNYRHWLAHGRYWVDKSGQEFAPLIAWQIIEAVRAELPRDFSAL